MNPLSRVTALVAAVAHGVVTEYRRLDAPPPPPEPPKAEINNTAATTQATWQRTHRAPASPFGFTKDGE